MNKVYDYVTEKIITELKNGVIPWSKPWSGTKAINYVTRKEYKGINTLLLQKSGEYLTFNQIKALKGSLKKGSKASMIVFYKISTSKEKEAEAKDKNYFILRYYNVFHISDCEGIESKIKTFEHDTITEAEEVIKNYNTKPAITNDDSNSAFYSPSSDFINIPSINHFPKIEEYYSTLFHESIHSTGHTSRLNRFINESKNAAFGSEEYSKEELIAEIGSAMLCNSVGILDNTIKNTTAYLQSWIKVLQNDNKFIIQASSKAQKAVNFILNIKEAEEA